VQAPAVPRVVCPPLSKTTVTVYARTLYRACELLGGVEALGKHLGVNAATLTRWIGGVEEPPTDAFLAAVDVVLLAAAPARGNG
jgi:hypothetical protein